MKNRTGIKKLSLKLHTQQPAAMHTMAAGLLGGKEVYTEPGLWVFELKDGTILEIYGPGSDYPAYLFQKNDLVPSYKVEDLKAALSKAMESGMQLLSPEKLIGACYSYCHLQDQEGNIIELNQD